MAVPFTKEPSNGSKSREYSCYSYLGTIPNFTSLNRRYLLEAASSSKSSSSKLFSLKHLIHPSYLAPTASGGGWVIGPAKSAGFHQLKFTLTLT